MRERTEKTGRGSLFALTLGAMGVVHGDVGTSPLYSFNEVFFGRSPLPIERGNVIGTVSLVVWTITVVVLLKYLLLVIRADNDGEGGTFALYALCHKHRKRGIGFLLWLLMLAAGLLFGEGTITPAISVLSAVEGLTAVAPVFSSWVVPLAIAILTVLFVLQRKGTKKVGAVFGPIIVLWFCAIAALGLAQVTEERGILAALDPLRGLALLSRLGWTGSLHLLGGVVLVITGGEAIYADMGHFGRTPIRLGGIALAYPALLLSYLGQGAYLLRAVPVANENVFYSLVPRVFLLPMVVLATLATITASQALLSGAFSLATQAVALGLFPRLQVVNTHHAHAGQTYVPFVNGALFVGCVFLVLKFGSSTNLAAAYGLSVSWVMLSTSIAMTAVARLYWRWRWPLVVVVCAPLAFVDATYLTASSLKFFEGGYIPLGLGVVLFAVMTTWRWGRKATFEAYSAKHTMKIRELVALKERASLFDRNAIILAPKPIRDADDNAPALMQLLWERWGVLPKNIVFLELVHPKVPYVHDRRYEVTVFQRSPERGCIASVTIAFGFMEDPNVERVLEGLATHHEIDLPVDPHKWIVHASQEKAILAKGAGPVTRLRLRLFSFLRHVSTPAFYYYGLGDEVQLSTEIMPVRVR